MSAWENFNGPFNFDATSLGPIGFPVVINNKPDVQKTWDFCSRKGFIIGTALNHYCYFHVVNRVTKALLLSDTVKFLHAYLNQPNVTEGDRIVHALNFISCSVKDSATTINHEHLTAISKLHYLFNNWILRTAMDPPTPSPAPPNTKVLAPPSLAEERKDTA